MKYLIVSDIHANLAAFKAVLEKAQAYSYQGFICLGDITGYGPEPEACVKKVKQIARKCESSFVLMGNHDAALIGKVPLSWFNEGAQFSVQLTKTLVSQETCSWIETLDARKMLGNFEYFYCLVHGSPIDPLTGYLLGGIETTHAFSWLECEDISLCLCGHTHHPFIFHQKGKTRIEFPTAGFKAQLSSKLVIANPGSVGFPRFISTKFVWGKRLNIKLEQYPAHFAVWDTDKKTIEWGEALYDRRPLERKLKKLKLSYSSKL